MDAACSGQGNPGLLAVERPGSYQTREAYGKRVAELDAMAGARRKAERS